MDLDPTVTLDRIAVLFSCVGSRSDGGERPGSRATVTAPMALSARGGNIGAAAFWLRERARLD